MDGKTYLSSPRKINRGTLPQARLTQLKCTHSRYNSEKMNDENKMIWHTHTYAPLMLFEPVSCIKFPNYSWWARLRVCQYVFIQKILPSVPCTRKTNGSTDIIRNVYYHLSFLCRTQMVIFLDEVLQVHILFPYLSLWISLVILDKSQIKSPWRSSYECGCTLSAWLVQACGQEQDCSRMRGSSQCLVGGLGVTDPLHFREWTLGCGTTPLNGSTPHVSSFRDAPPDQTWCT